jgi:hypothetical protein
MITSPKVYPENDTITIVFDKEDSHEAWLISAFRDAFGEAYTMLEALDAHRCCLHLRRGGLLEIRR